MIYVEKLVVERGKMPNAYLKHLDLRHPKNRNYQLTKRFYVDGITAKECSIEFNITEVRVIQILEKMARQIRWGIIREKG